MKKDLILARRAIESGKDLDVQLPVYFTEMAGLYYRLAFCNLAMEYGYLDELLFEAEEDTEEFSVPIAKELSGIASQVGKDDQTPEQMEAAYERLTELRALITAYMSSLTAYTEKLYLHESALSRLAPGMEGTILDVSAEEAAKEIFSILTKTIFPKGMDNKNGAKNTKATQEMLSYVLKELPIRMTKARFLDMIREGLTGFGMATEEMLELSIYVLSSSAGMTAPKEEGKFPYFEQLLTVLDSIDYKTIDFETYTDARSRLQEAARVMKRGTDACTLLMRLANLLMTIVLMKPYISSEAREESTPAATALMLLMDDSAQESDELLQAYEKLEGLPEDAEDQLLSSEDLLSTLPVDESLIEASMQSVLLARLRFAKKLHSSSLFMDLVDAKRSTKLEGRSTKENCEAMVQQFLDDMATTLEGGQRAINRARMANVISHLPVPVNGPDDLSKYIEAAFMNCHDMSEKTAALLAIRKLAKEM